MTKMTNKYEMHVISHSHWDREWRYSFAEYRLKLVEMMDRLLSMLGTNPHYKYYHLDGQTILLEDYLEIRPEKEDLLKRYIQNGRILVGPWYTLPDEFLVGGESLVRNLLRGHRTAGRFGRTMKVGYTPTSCGQISQLPQLYAGFDIDSIFFYRGLNAFDAPAEFIWQSPDGSRALTFHFYTWGRANFSHLILYPVLFDGWKEFSLQDAKRFLHLQNQPYPYVVDLPDLLHYFHHNQLAPMLRRVKEDALQHATTPYLLYMDGCDNGAPVPLTVEIINEANKISVGDKYIHSNLPEYVRKVKTSIRHAKILRGEMRHPGKEQTNAVYSGSLSARIYIKQLNTRAEINLIRRAEPWATIAWLQGEDYPGAVLEKAWKYLLANHTHDSMEAMSIDRVHADNEYRFAQCNEMSLGILRRSLNYLARCMPVREKDEFSLVVFNPLPYERSETISAILTFPENAGVKTFSLYDASEEIPYEKTGQRTRSILVERPEINTGSFPANQFTIDFTARAIPALGYRVFRVIPHGTTGAGKQPGLIPEKNTLENEFLKVCINTDGTLNIKDKKTGRNFLRLHSFEDGGEAGDSLWHKPPEKDQLVTTLNAKAKISLEKDNAFSAAYRIETKMVLPARLAPDGKGRARQKEKISITSRITLTRGSKRLDVVTTLKNNIRDHRLRVLFPSGIDTDCSWAGGQFDVLQRPIKTPYKKGWAEPKVTTHPQYSFVDLSDEKTGLAIINEGLTEYEAVDDKERTLAITLVRAIENICGIPSCDNEGGQCLRDFEYRYAIYPHAGNYQTGKVFLQVQSHQLPLEIMQSGRGDEEDGNSRGFLSIEPDSLVLSALKKSEDRATLIVRFFNPGTSTVKGKIRSFRDIKSAWETNLNEERRKELRIVHRNTISLMVKPKKIMTLELLLK